MGSVAPPAATESYDVVIVGAGVSGINSAYRVQTQAPQCSYTIIEARNDIGGTWDLFKYPGIRSDSDLHTFGFPWRLWAKTRSIVDGADIKQYVKDSAAEYGIDKKIQYKHKLLSSDWSSSEQNWNLKVENNGREKLVKAKWVLFSTGYYDYNTPLQTTIPGIDNFQGQKIHPQFWPEKFDYSGKKVVIIGSGATAITLLPNMAKTASKVTMLQRSPTWIINQPGSDPLGRFWHAILPTWLSARFTRWKYLIVPLLFFYFCRAFPKAARGIMNLFTRHDLKGSMDIDPAFNPKYNPWEQRLCVCPDGDLFQVIRSGKGDIVTDHIQEVQKNGILTKSGKFIEADVIVTATGLKVQLVGGSKISVDGKPWEFYEKFLWRNAMISGLPNAILVIGYTNASWTLGADASGLLFTRLLNYMEGQGYSSAVPVAPGSMEPNPAFNLSSTYLEKAKGELPWTGDKGPWKLRENYFYDRWTALHGDLHDGVEYTPGETRKTQ